jgi:hypothetical protein
MNSDQRRHYDHQRTLAARQELPSMAAFWGMPEQTVEPMMFSQPQSGHIPARIATVLNEWEQPDENELERAFNEPPGAFERYAANELPADFEAMSFEAMTVANGIVDHSNPQFRAY